MERTSQSWPVVVALLALVGFAVTRHAMDREAHRPQRQAPSERPCRIDGRSCSSLERVQSIRGLRLNHNEP